MISLLISFVVIVLIGCVLVWCLRYMGAPEIATKVIVVLLVLVALLMLLDGFGIYRAPWHGAYLR